MLRVRTDRQWYVRASDSFFCVFEYAFFVFLRVSFCESMQFDGLEYVLPLPYGTI